MITYKKALEIILKNIKPIKQVESVGIEKCILRVLSKDYKANSNSPAFDKSSMDGIIIKKTDFKKIKKFKIVGELKAGQKFSKDIKKGEAKIIFTGAPIPIGSSKIVIIKENINFIDEKNVIISSNIDLKSNNIRKKGIDFKKGELCLKRNTQLNSRALSLAYSLDLKNIKVIKKPKIAIIITGNEIKSNNNPRGNINSSNTITISNLVNFFGGEVVDIKFSLDSIDSIINSFNSLRNFDLLITSGGLSVGKYDLVKNALLRKKLKIYFEKVAMKPGKPCTFGRFGQKKYFIGLPGNPVSCFVGTITFVNLIIQKLLGVKKKDFINFCSAVSEDLIPKNNKLTSFLRIIINEKNGILSFKVLENQDSSLLLTLNKSDGIIIRYPYEPEIIKGQKVRVIQFKSFQNFFI